MKNSFDLALNYLTYKSRTEKEIETYLKKKKFSDSSINNTLKKLKEYNYIDDTNYIKQVYESNHLNQRFGKKRLIYSLKKKGISESLLAKFDELFTQEEELNNCKFHFKKILNKTEKDPYKKRIQKINYYLQNKGFSYNLFSNLLESVPKENEIDKDKLLNLINQAYNRYSKKDISKYELKNKIIKNLLNKGYSYSDIKEIYEINYEQEM